VSNNNIVGHPYIGNQVLAVGTNPFYVADTDMETWLLIVIICSGVLFLIISVLIIYCCCCKKS